MDLSETVKAVFVPSRRVCAFVTRGLRGGMHACLLLPRQASGLGAPRTIIRQTLKVSHWLSRIRLVGFCVSEGQIFIRTTSFASFTHSRAVLASIAFSTLAVPREIRVSSSFFSFFRNSLCFYRFLYHGDQIISHQKLAWTSTRTGIPSGFHSDTRVRRRDGLCFWSSRSEVNAFIV